MSEQRPIPDGAEFARRLAELQASLDSTGQAIEGHPEWLGNDLEGVGRWQLDVDAVMEQAQPDLVLLGSDTDAEAEAEMLRSLGLPFTVLGAEHSSFSDDPLWLTVDFTGADAIEPSLRDALTRWLCGGD